MITFEGRFVKNDPSPKRHIKFYALRFGHGLRLSYAQKHSGVQHRWSQKLLRTTRNPQKSRAVFASRNEGRGSRAKGGDDDASTVAALLVLLASQRPQHRSPHSFRPRGPGWRQRLRQEALQPRRGGPPTPENGSPQARRSAA